MNNTRILLKWSSWFKWIGVLGFPMFFSNWYFWKILWLFWLFAVLEIMITFPTFIQSLRQIVGIIVADINNKPMPDIENYIPKVKYSLPFNGEWVVVNGGVTKEYSHSWEINSQRYAYDFIILNNEGKSYIGDEMLLNNYCCYGCPVLSPADGIVVEIRTDCKDSKIIGSGKTDRLIKDIRGNYIVIKHSDDEFSCLAHLAPRSIMVSVGQKVRRKEQIALSGNSGNTSEPHLHFQIQNTKNFFNSAGLPIHFENINIESQPNYKEYDSRHIPIAYTNFISRGQRVCNL